MKRWKTERHRIKGQADDNFTDKLEDMLIWLDVYTSMSFVNSFHKNGPLEFGEPPKDYFQNDERRIFTKWVILEGSFYYQGELINNKPDGRGLLVQHKKGFRIGYCKNGFGHGKGFAIMVNGIKEESNCKFGRAHGLVAKSKMGLRLSTKVFVYGKEQ